MTKTNESMIVAKKNVHTSNPFAVQTKVIGHIEYQRQKIPLSCSWHISDIRRSSWKKAGGSWSMTCKFPTNGIDESGRNEIFR